MKKIFLTCIVLIIGYNQSSAQKFKSILDKSSLSFNYGVSYNYYAEKPGGGSISALNLDNVDPWGQIFGAEFSYSISEKNELGFGFTKQTHQRTYNESLQTPFASINVKDFVFKDTKNFHHLFWKRHIVPNRLLGTVGLYTIFYRDSELQVNNTANQTIVTLSDAPRGQLDFGAFVGLEYYHDIRNFQVGIRSRLFYTIGVFESIEFTPIIKFKL